MVSPEQGQKMPDTATEADTSVADTIETSSDIPQTTTNGINKDINSCNSQVSDTESKEISETSCQSGEVHMI